MPITREQWIEVESAVDVYLDQKQKTRKDFNALLYNVQDSDKSQENHLGIGSIGQMSPWTGQVSYQEFKKGYEKGFRHAKYSSGIQFEEEIFRFKEYNKIKDGVGKLDLAIYKTLQAYGVSVFNNAFDATFPGPDAVALCSTAHPYSPSDARTQSNAGTLPLTMANLKTAFNAMLGLVDDNGDQIFAMPNVLLTGIDYREEAMKICGVPANDKEPFTAENDANIYKGDLTYIFHPLITGKKWFLIDSELMKERLFWYNARKAKIETDGDFDTEVMKFKAVSMFSNGFTDYKFIVGNVA
jgi:hypothetical protein